VCDAFDWYEHTGVTQSGDYTHTFTNAAGYDSLVTLHLTVNYSTIGDTTAIACDSFDWYEHTNITASCENLTHTFTNANGCDSVVTLHLTINHSNTGDTTATACESFDWYEHTNIAASCDDLTHTFTNASGCDSVVTLHLTINHSNTGDTMAVAQGTFTWYEHENVTVSGDYMHVFTNSAGCDSVVTLHLVINQNNTGDTTAIECDSFDWYEYTNLTQSGNYTHTFINSAGSDSVVTLHLTINQSTTSIDEHTECDSLRWIDGYLYTSDNNTATYTLMNTAGCDSIVTLNLTVHHPDHQYVPVSVINEYNWHNNLYTESGLYTFSFEDENGCTQVDTLFLTVRYSIELPETACDSFVWHDRTFYQSTDTATYHTTTSTGSDSLVTLHLTINHSSTGDTTAVACDRFDWYEHTNITASCDNLTHTFTNASGCDSVVTLHLTVNYSTTGDTTAIACDRFDWYEHTNITASCDNLTHTFTNASGCDSVVTLHLTINHSNTGDTTATACESFDWYEHTNITSSCNNLTHTFTNASGCDSMVTLHLTINHSNTGDTMAAACESFDWYEHTNITASCDNLTHTFMNANGCDSVVTLHLTINHSNTGDTMAAACESFDWYEHTNITVSCDNLTHTFTNANGCDSVVTLHLTINHSNTGDTSATACNSFDWYEHTNIAISGDYTHTFTNASGCDSAVTLHLTILYGGVGDTNAVACNSFDWYEYVGITSSGDYTHTFTNASGCDSVVTLHLIVNPSYNQNESLTILEEQLPYTWRDTTFQIGAQSGEYVFYRQSVSGCDSVVTLELYIVVPPPPEPEPQLDMMRLPNAITPSDYDGLNDFFSIPDGFLNQIGEFEIIIFNRWGETVFYSNDKHFRWYGDYQGKICVDQVFGYKMKFFNKDGIIYRRKGSILVL
ncbi:MAG: gliding motility-associated C-terminal domain-containing protein, partial [Bacteroidales bacterium]|nr:gliding motility-associated C-terminal domain-containing protein [Bacteroidales bacterium]